MAALAALLLALAGCVASGDQVAGGATTPPRTLRPVFTSTTTPTATAVPSDTPLPTDTPVPTETPLPPSDTPAPTGTPSPTETPSAVPSPTIPPTRQPTKPAVAPTATTTPRPQVDFRVAEIVAFEDGSLTVTGLHNVYFTVLDASGAPLDGIILEEVNNQPTVRLISGDKGPGKAEFTMWAGDYRFKVVGNTGGQALSSETTHILSIVYRHAVWEDLIAGGICSSEADCLAQGPMHYSYRVTFQRNW